MVDSYRNTISEWAVGFRYGNFTLKLARGKKSLVWAKASAKRGQRNPRFLSPENGNEKLTSGNSSPAHNELMEEESKILDFNFNGL